jgi:hypothetical protein
VLESALPYPEIPTAASYAQTEAPAERKRQKERDGFLHDVTQRKGVAVRMDNLGFSEEARGVRCEAVAGTP